MLLFHLAAIGCLPDGLRDVIQHPNFLKVGVNVTGDVWKLARDFDLPQALDCVRQSCVDLGTLMRQQRPELPEQRWSLAELAESVLGASLSKEAAIRQGDWTMIPLSAELRRYAALDAFASWMIHQLLAKKAV